MTTAVLAPDGYDLSSSWAGVAGASSVEVSPAPLSITPLPREVVRGPVPIVAAAGGYQASADGAPVRALGLAGLASGDRKLGDADDLAAAGLRLVVAVSSAGAWVPAYAAPGAGLPPGIAAAAFAAGVLHLPDPALGTFLVLLTTGTSAPFPPAPITLSGLTLTTLTRASDVAAVLDGATVWSAQGTLAGTVRTDLAAMARLALSKGLAGSGPGLPIRLQLTSTIPADVELTWSGVHGTLVRTVSQPITVALAGDPLAMALTPSPPGEPPASVSADVTLTYLGIRLHDSVDERPTSDGPARGPVVGDDPVIRRLPPAALDGSRPVRIGLVGRAVEDAELTVTLVGPAGQPVAPAGTVAVVRSPSIGTVWADLPSPTTVSVPIGVAVRATRGVFLWVADPDPLVRIAVADPQPGDRPVLCDAAPLPASVAPAEGKPQPVLTRRVALPPDGFGGRLPVLSSRLFVTIRFDQLSLRYPR
jgi:hypothetical protein